MSSEMSEGMKLVINDCYLHILNDMQITSQVQVLLLEKEVLTYDRAQFIFAPRLAREECISRLVTDLKRSSRRSFYSFIDVLRESGQHKVAGEFEKRLWVLHREAIRVKVRAAMDKGASSHLADGQVVVDRHWLDSCEDLALGRSGSNPGPLTITLETTITPQSKLAYISTAAATELCEAVGGEPYTVVRQQQGGLTLCDYRTGSLLTLDAVLAVHGEHQMHRVWARPDLNIYVALTVGPRRGVRVKDSHGSDIGSGMSFAEWWENSPVAGGVKVLQVHYT